ncbi:hypothetical protein ACTVBU_10790 [Sanguibacter sp. A246]|uniref:hypothetical protein n=1 Tax=Sanguibacter sp. A246 TaxID=3457326 RepID=UPI003FD8D107
MSFDDERIASVRALISALRLAGVRAVDLRAHVDDALEVSDPVSGDMQIRTGMRVRPSGVDYRIMADASFPYGSLHATLVAAFELEAKTSVGEPSALRAFGTEVAAMTLYPYLRQTLADLAQRVGAEFVLPFVERGQISFEDGQLDGAEAADIAD